MASDRQQYRDALERQRELHEAGEYSVPPDIGRVAILCSGYVYRIDKSREQRKAAKADLAAFRREALQLNEALQAQGYKVDLILGADEDAVEAVLQNRQVSDVITIGHGSLSTFSVQRREGITPYSWLEVSEAADHLKRGQFMQRSCAHFPRNLPVPFGAFAMAGLDQVIAATGHEFTPDDLDDPLNTMLQPISTTPEMPDYDELSNFLKAQEAKLAAEYNARNLAVAVLSSYA